MPNIMTKEAWEVAKKLTREKPKKPGRKSFSVEAKEDGKHTKIKVLYGDVVVGQYGIMRASKEQRHNWVPEQLHLTRSEGYNLAKCPLTVDEFIDLLIERGEIEDSDKDKPDSTDASKSEPSRGE